MTAHATVSPPRIPNALEPLTLDADDMLDEPAFTDVAVTGSQLAGTHAQALAFTRMRLAKVNLSESRLPRFDISDVTFTDCNLSNLRTDEFSFRRAAIAQSKLTGIHFVSGTLGNTAFVDSMLDFARFDNVKFKNVSFLRCQIRDADFLNGSFEDVAFVECDLSRSTFARLRIGASQMRGCRMTGLRGLNQLKGITMAWNDILENAELFAAELGIQIG